jgi:hypothetical protein
VLRSKALKRCTLVLGHYCVPAPRSLRMIRVAMCWTSGCLLSIVCSLTAKRSLASSKAAAPNKRPAS